MRFTAPRKILRNSPAALPLAQLIVAKKICSDLRFMFRQITILATTQSERRLMLMPLTFRQTAPSSLSGESLKKVCYRRRMLSGQIENDKCNLFWVDPNFISPESLALKYIVKQCITDRDDFIAVI
jgi:hypothetical protein